MAELLTPRAMIRALLRDEPLPRPLLLPIVFALGARLDNLTMRAFLANPTKIANSQRQIRSVLGLDGVIGYFDPYLEAEALGCEMTWSADESTCALRAAVSEALELDERLSSPEAVVQCGRIPLACDVLRRLKTMLTGEPALMVAVTGPYLLAEQLIGGARGAQSEHGAVELTSEITAAVGKIFLESGANVIFIREEGAFIRDSKRWAELLSPIINVIRFYEALPVLMFNGQEPTAAITALNASCEGAICPVESNLAVATLDISLRVVTRDTMPELITSRGDIPAETDMKLLANVCAGLRVASRVA